ncbi:MAG TPA: hypothetical protein VMV47_11350 [Bacteroidales bacterium]|nr:hypothetical protein [Bacteroidales bacterium]
MKKEDIEFREILNSKYKNLTIGQIKEIFDILNKEKEICKYLENEYFQNNISFNPVFTLLEPDTKIEMFVVKTNKGEIEISDHGNFPFTTGGTIKRKRHVFFPVFMRSVKSCKSEMKEALKDFKTKNHKGCNENMFRLLFECIERTSLGPEQKSTVTGMFMIHYGISFNKVLQDEGKFYANSKNEGMNWERYLSNNVKRLLESRGFKFS